jgi:hypothetical protein
MLHNNLLSYYENIFAFKQFHGWNIDEIESLLPWELDVVMSLITNLIEQRKLEQRQREANL